MRRVGEGFYGVVYRVDLPQPPGRAIVKWYKTPGHHRREGAQLDLLRPHSRLPVPEVYGYHDGDDALPFQAMAMAWAPGINASLLPTCLLYTSDRRKSKKLPFAFRARFQ